MQKNSFKTSNQSRLLQTHFGSLGTPTPLPYFRICPKKVSCFSNPFPILNYGIQFNSYAKRLQVEFKIFLGHKTFTFHDSSMSSLEWQFSSWYCFITVANKLRKVVARGLGRPEVGAILLVSGYIPSVSHQESKYKNASV